MSGIFQASSFGTSPPASTMPRLIAVRIVPTTSAVTNAVRRRRGVEQRMTQAALFYAARPRDAEAMARPVAGAEVEGGGHGPIVAPAAVARTAAAAKA